MAVNIDNLTITTPVAKSATNPVALELTGAQALTTLPQVVRRLADGTVRLMAPTRGAAVRSPPGGDVLRIACTRASDRWSSMS